MLLKAREQNFRAVFDGGGEMNTEDADELFRKMSETRGFRWEE